MASKLGSLTPLCFSLSASRANQLSSGDIQDFANRQYGRLLSLFPIFFGNCAALHCIVYMLQLCDCASLVHGVLQAIMLDEVLNSGTRPQADHLLQFETRSLRDTRQLLRTVSSTDTLQFVEQNPHPRYISPSALLLPLYLMLKNPFLHRSFGHPPCTVSRMVAPAFGHFGY